MPRPLRSTPRELVPSWPDGPAADAVGEIARRFAANVRDAIGARSIRKAAESIGVHHATLLAILDGRTWPDLETIAKIELGLGTEIWPRRHR